MLLSNLPNICDDCAVLLMAIETEIATAESFVEDDSYVLAANHIDNIGEAFAKYIEHLERELQDASQKRRS